MWIVRNFFVLLICLHFFSCKEDVTSLDGTITASTSKQVYQSGEDVLVYINNNLEEDVYLRECGDYLDPVIERLDSSYGSSFTAVCRNPTLYKLESFKSVIDTLKLNTGFFRIKYFYEFDNNIYPGIYSKELITNEFRVE